MNLECENVGRKKNIQETRAFFVATSKEDAAVEKRDGNRRGMCEIQSGTAHRIFNDNDGVMYAYKSQL